MLFRSGVRVSLSVTVFRMVEDGLNNEPPLRSTGWRMFRPSETQSETQSENSGTKRQSASHSSSKNEPYRGDDMRALINFAMATGLAIVIGADFNYVDAQSISNGEASNGPSAPASLPSNNLGAMASSASTNRPIQRCRIDQITLFKCQP